MWNFRIDYLNGRGKSIKAFVQNSNSIQNPYVYLEIWNHATKTKYNGKDGSYFIGSHRVSYFTLLHWRIEQNKDNKYWCNRACLYAFISRWYIEIQHSVMLLGWGEMKNISYHKGYIISNGKKCLFLWTHEWKLVKIYYIRYLYFTCLIDIFMM